VALAQVAGEGTLELGHPGALGDPAASEGGDERRLLLGAERGTADGDDGSLPLTS